MWCDLLKYAFVAAWVVIAPAGAILAGYAQQSLIDSYGWGVFYRYRYRDLYGSLLSRRERRMFWSGVFLIIVFVVINVVTIATCGKRTG